MSTSSDAPSLLHRRRPAPLHLHTSSSDVGQHGDIPTSAAMSGGPSGQSSAEDAGQYVAGGGQGNVNAPNGNNPPPFGSSPYSNGGGGGGGQYPPSSLPHSHSMPIPTSHSYYTPGLYHPPYSAGPATTSFGGAQNQPMSAPPIAPYNPPYGERGGSGTTPNGTQPPSIMHSQSAPAVPLSASATSPGLSSPIYGNYPPYHAQAVQYRQGPPSSSPYTAAYPYTPQYGSFSYDHPSSATSTTHDATGQSQPSDYFGDRSYRSSGSVTTASGQRYPAYQAKVPLVDRPFKCDECIQSFNRNHDLKRHKRIHLAVKPFSCEKCGKQFSRKDALRRHWLVKGCRGDEEAPGVNSHFTGPPPALSPTTPDTPSYPASAPALPNSSHNPYFPHIPPAPSHSTPSMVRQYSAGTILVTPKEEQGYQQYHQSPTAGDGDVDVNRKHNSVSISSNAPGSTSRWNASTASNVPSTRGISPTSSTVSHIPPSKYAAATTHPRSASSAGGAGPTGSTEGGVLASQGGRERAEDGGGDGGATSRANSWAAGGRSTGSRPSLGGWSGGVYAGEGARQSWSGENGGERRLAGLGSRHDHVFREPFPQQLSADQQRWSSIEMIPSSSSSSDPSDAPTGPSMSISYSYPGAQQPQYQQEGSGPLSMTESEEQQMMGQQGGSSQWQRWHRPSFPFPIRNGNIYQAPTSIDGPIPEQEEGVRDHRMGSIGVDVVS